MCFNAIKVDLLFVLYSFKEKKKIFVLHFFLKAQGDISKSSVQILKLPINCKPEWAFKRSQLQSCNFPSLKKKITSTPLTPCVVQLPVKHAQMSLSLHLSSLYTSVLPSLNNPPPPDIILSWNATMIDPHSPVNLSLFSRASAICLFSGSGSQLNAAGFL